MNKQVYAALSLICGLLGFNLIAIVQTTSYLQTKSYLHSQGELDISTLATPSFYRISAIILGGLGIALYLMYKRTDDTGARLIANLGFILGILSLALGILDIWKWLL